MCSESIINTGVIPGKQVKHKLFGVGLIVEVNDGRIVVDFSGEQKMFQFPTAFRSFLETDDDKLKSLINYAIEKEDAARRKAEEERAAAESKRLAAKLV